MRTVVWERKPRIPPPLRSEAAERIRARMRPGPITRVTDTLVQWLDKWVERFDALDERVTNKVGKSAGLIAAGILAVVFLMSGRMEMAPLFFGAFAVSALLARVSYMWHKRHPLPPVYERTARHEIRAVAQAIIGGAIIAFLSMILAFSFEPAYDPLQSLYHGAIGSIGLYGFRTIDERPPPSGLLTVAVGWIVLVVLLFFFI